MKNQILLTFIIVAILVSCAPSSASAPTETVNVADVTLTLTPTTSRPINTRTSTATPTPIALPTSTPTNTPRPFIIAYAYTSDGGDEFTGCMQDSTGHPSFILYQDGVLIKRGQRYYLQSQLSQTEINELMERIAKTGLLQKSEMSYQEGNSVLIVNGKGFHAPWDLPATDPLSQAITVVRSFQPQNVTRFIPENMLLMVFFVAELDNTIEDWLPKPNPAFQDWQSSPFRKYGIGWFTITGEEVPKIMKQFSGFPDFRVYKDSKTKGYYVAAICTNYPYR